MTGPVRVVALLTTLPGKGAEQVEAFTTLAPVVRAEDGCLQYDLHAVLGNPDRFAVIERWSSADALSAHAKSEHMRVSAAAATAFRAGPAEVLVLSDDAIAWHDRLARRPAHDLSATAPAPPRHMRRPRARC